MAASGDIDCHSDLVPVGARALWEVTSKPKKPTLDNEPITTEIKRVIRSAVSSPIHDDSLLPATLGTGSWDPARVSMQSEQHGWVGGGGFQHGGCVTVVIQRLSRTDPKSRSQNSGAALGTEKCKTMGSREPRLLIWAFSMLLKARAASEPHSGRPRSGESVVLS